jgi:hypothetical protein
MKTPAAELKILIKIATNNKLDKFMVAWEDYLSKVQNKENTYFLVTLEKDDQAANVIFNHLKNTPNTTVIIGNSKSKIDAINRDIKEFSKLNDWDVLVVANTETTPALIGFDESIREKFYELKTTDCALFSNDGFLGNSLNTIPIMGRKYYNRFGYVYSDEYKSVFYHEEYTDLANKLNKLIYCEKSLIKRKFVLPSYSKNQICEIDRNTFEKRKKRAGIPKILTPDYKKDYQYPAITEKQALYNHLNTFSQKNTEFIDVYLGFPWASLIDDIISCIDSEKDIDSLRETAEKIKHFRELANSVNKQLRVHTVCQHIKWAKIKDIFISTGIDDLHISHCVKNIEIEKIRIHPWSLAAANSENIASICGLSIKPARKKELFFSFIGSHCHNYRSEIRLKIKEIVEKNNFQNILFLLEGRWFFEDIVYKEQLKNAYLGDSFYEDMKKRTKNYNEVLSNSIFALCPEGSGPNTIRLWESMSVGAIPVLFENDWDPPRISKMNLEWKDISVLVPKQETENFYEILKSISAEKIEEMQSNCLNAYNQFRLMTCFE